MANSTWSPCVTTLRPSSHHVNMDFRVLAPIVLAPHWLGAPTMDLGFPVLRGIRSTKYEECKTNYVPLMPLISCTEFESERAYPLPTKAANDKCFQRTALPWSFGLYDAYRDRQRPTPSHPKTRLCGAFRFSQPLDALFRLKPSGLISCR